MEDKDVEELLRKSAESIDPGDFSVRYKAIKHKLKKHKQPTKRFNFRVLATASLSVILVALIILPFTITSLNSSTPTPTPPPEKYFIDDLKFEIVDEPRFYAELNKADYKYANFDMEYAGNYQLIVTQTQKVKGGAIEFSDESGNSAKYVAVKFFDTAVILHEELYADYNLKYEVGGASIKYKLVERIEMEGITAYSYAAYATYKNMNYTISYSALKDDVTDLFNTMFT